MSQMHDTDIVIAGGGVAGAAFALGAAAGGLRVTLLDPTAEATRAAPDFDGRAYALAAASVRYLQAAGVWLAVAAQAEPMRAIEIHDGRPGAPGPARLRFDGPGPDGQPFAVLLEDRWLRPALLRAVAEAPLIAHRAPARAVSAQPAGGGVVVTLEGGETLRAAVVVAADGRRSALAASAGVTWTGRRYAQTGLVCAVEHDIPHDGLARQVFYPGGPFAMLPLPQGRSAIVWSERDAEAARIAALDDRAYALQVAARAGGLLGRLRLAGRRWRYPLELALAHDYVAPRLALLGDAAHAVHPIAGQGLNLGLRDAAALAEVLAEARRRGEDIGAADVLARYQAWRRFDGATFGGATDALNLLFSTDSGPLRSLRDLGLGLVNALPGFKRAVIAAAAGRSGDLPRMLRGAAP